MATDRPRRAAYDAWLDEPLATDGDEDEDAVTDATVADSTSSATGDGKCRECGAFVSAAFRRVFGGNDGEVNVCMECATGRDRKRGAVADVIAEDKP